jgi:predicted alpha/beta-hydrolase family hydrolase
MLNVKIPIKQESETSVQLEGELSFPASIANNTNGIVILAHGSGSSRHSSRNHYVVVRIASGWFRCYFPRKEHMQLKAAKMTLYGR